MNQFHLLEHTADIGIEAIATNSAGLAEQSAFGIKFLLFGEIEAESRHSEKVCADGNSAEETMVNWLNTVDYFTETGLAATISGEYFDPERHRMLREIKAVTHHQTKIDQRGKLWHSTVYLDL